MTTAQITSTFNELNTVFPGSYMLDAPIPMNEVAYIVLDSDEVLYPDNKIQRFYFDSEFEMLSVYSGKYNQDGSFTLENHPDYIIDFALMIGFVMVSDAIKQSQYKYGMR